MYLIISLCMSDFIVLWLNILSHIQQNREIATRTASQSEITKYGVLIVAIVSDACIYAV